MRIVKPVYVSTKWRNSHHQALKTLDYRRERCRNWATKDRAFGGRYEYKRKAQRHNMRNPFESAWKKGAARWGWNG